MGKMLWGIRKILPNYIGKILREGTQYSSYIYRSAIVRKGTLENMVVAHIYRSDFAYGYAKSLLYIWEWF